MSERSCIRRVGVVLGAVTLGLAAVAPLAAQSGRLQGEVRAVGSARPLAGAQVFVVGGRVGAVTGRTAGS